MNGGPPSHDASSVPDDANRYARIQLEAGEVVIYDRERTNAWLQSDATLSVDARTDGSAAADSVVERGRHLAAKHAENPITGDESDS